MAAVDDISANFLHGLKEHTRGRGVAPRRASGYDRSIYKNNFPGIPYSWQDVPTGRNEIKKAEGNTAFRGMLSSKASVKLVDTQIDLEASAKLPDTDVALDVALEDDRQAILACAHAMHMGGCRAGGYNRLFQITSRASSPPTTPHARCARNLEASQTQCEDPEGNPKSGLCGPIWLYTSLQRNLDSALDEEATRDSYGELAKDLVADDQPEALHVHVYSQLC